MNGDKTVIDGFEVEMMDCDGHMNCFIMSRARGASASLAALDAEGVLTPTSRLGDIVEVSQITIDKITEWALAHGY